MSILYEIHVQRYKHNDPAYAPIYAGTLGLYEAQMNSLSCLGGAWRCPVSVMTPRGQGHSCQKYQEIRCAVILNYRFSIHTCD